MGETKMLEFVMEGHDGAGKSTVLAGVKKKLEQKGITTKIHAPFYLVKELIPEDDIFCYWKNRANTAVNLLSKAIKQAREQPSNPQVLLFDRHWMTIFSEIENTPLENNWNDFPPTFFLQAAPNVTKSHERFTYDCPFTNNDEEITKYYHIFNNLTQKYSYHILGKYLVTCKQQDLTPIVDDICSKIEEKLF
jgi:thymidylate kinase